MVNERQTPEPLILFDGVCNLCCGFVQFVIRRERQQRFKFASLQSEIGGALLGSSKALDLSAIVLIDNGHHYRKSAAVLRIALKLNKLWPVLYCFMLIPGPLRDLIYDFIGNRRYFWFGKTESCWLPTDQLAKRFVSEITDVHHSEFKDMLPDNNNRQPG